MSVMKKLASMALIALLVLALAACADETRSSISDAIGSASTTAVDGGDSGAETPSTTAVDGGDSGAESPAPEPEPEPAPEDGGLSTEAIVILALIVGLGLIILLLIGRRRPAQVSQQVTTAPPPPPSSGPTWSDRARMTYADARWIHDNSDGEVAVWRATHGDAGLSASDTSRLGLASRDLDERILRTVDEVYRLEAAATILDQRDAARNVGVALKSVQSAFETRVAAHRASLAAGPGGGPEPAAADSEADARLLQARRSLTSALDQLSATA